MLAMVSFFILGWFGTHWWGEWFDAPNPHDPQPWARLVTGIVGGIAAVVVSRVGVGSSDPMPGVVLSIATGRVAAAIVAPILRSTKRTN